MPGSVAKGKGGNILAFINVSGMETKKVKGRLPMKNLIAIYNKCVLEMIDINMDISDKIVSVKCNHRLTAALGRCKRNSRTGIYEIEISPVMLADNVDDRVTKDTIIHELIHTCPGCMNHGYEWKRRAEIVNRKLGYNISRLAKTSELVSHGVEVKRREYKYALKCPKCGAEWKYKKWCDALENPGRYQCGKCKEKLYTIGLNGNQVWTARPI